MLAQQSLLAAKANTEVAIRATAALILMIFDFMEFSSLKFE